MRASASASRSRTPCVVARPPLGTPVAIYSRAALSTGRCKWGGARNAGTRESGWLTEKQTANIVDAAAHAIRIGLPLNRQGRDPHTAGR